MVLGVKFSYYVTVNNYVFSGIALINIHIQISFFNWFNKT